MTASSITLSEAFMALQCAVLIATVLLCAIAARGGNHGR